MTVMVSCSKVTNRYDSEILTCGDNSDQEHYALIQIEDDIPFEAFLIRNTEIKPVRVTAKSCIVVQADDRGFRLMVRDSATKRQGFALDLTSLPPGLSHFSLKPDSSLNRQQHAIARCPSAEIPVIDEFIPSVKYQESQQVSYSMARITVYDQAQRDHQGKGFRNYPGRSQGSYRFA